jgi:NAD(P)H dehydrogenase (quinone)
VRAPGLGEFAWGRRCDAHGSLSIDPPITIHKEERRLTMNSAAGTPRVAVIYYSATGTVYKLAGSVAEGAESAGGEVRLRRVAELAPPAAIDANPAWRAHHDATVQVPVASHADLVWADALALGTPTRFGNVASQLKQFIDTTGTLWADGVLADKAVTAFTSAGNRHGGNESTLLALYNTAYHWGALIVPPGAAHVSARESGGNPYGTAHPSLDGPPSEHVLAAARYQGRRLVEVARQLCGLRDDRQAA